MGANLVSSKPMKISGKRVAYAVTSDDLKTWGVGITTEGEPGYRPVPDYGPYDEEERARGVVDRLNARINVGPKLAAAIVLSSMRGSGAVRQ